MYVNIYMQYLARSPSNKHRLPDGQTRHARGALDPSPLAPLPLLLPLPLPLFLSLSLSLSIHVYIYICMCIYIYDYV